jgi:hypothetical protein
METPLMRTIRLLKEEGEGEEEGFSLPVLTKENDEQVLPCV